MNFCHKLLNGPIIFDENHPAVLVVENPKAFTQILSDLLILLEDDESDCGLYENNAPISASKRLELITDPLSVDPNQKKVLNALYSLLEKQMWNEDNFVHTSETLSSMQGYLSHLAECTDYPITFSEQIGGAALFKAAEMRLETEAVSLLERLDAYISAAREFLKKDVFFFVGLHSYLTADELELLYRSAAYRKNKLFLLEGYESESIPGETRIVIDKDLCQLNLGWQNNS
jgi:CRISPR-associated protein Csn2